jgi:hypothetical protein
MLIVNFQDHPTVNPMLKGLANSLAMGHVSRYPIAVEVAHNQKLKFNDYRTSISPTIVMVTETEGKFYIQSERISNNKYREGTVSFNTKITSSLAAARKILKELVTPFTPDELFQKNILEARNVYQAWRHEYGKQYMEVIEVNKGDLISDVLAYYEAGRMPEDWASLRNMVDPEVLLRCKTHLSRSALTPPSKHVFINPDGVVFSYASAGAYMAALQEATTVNSVADLPVEIQEKIALLKISPEKSVVDNVGLRMGSTFMSMF